MLNAVTNVPCRCPSDTIPQMLRSLPNSFNTFSNIYPNPTFSGYVHYLVRLTKRSHAHCTTTLTLSTVHFISASHSNLTSQIALRPDIAQLIHVLSLPSGLYEIPHSDINHRHKLQLPSALKSMNNLTSLSCGRYSLYWWLQSLTPCR